MASFACPDMLRSNLLLNSSKKGGIDQAGVETPRWTLPKQSETERVRGTSQILHLD